MVLGRDTDIKIDEDVWEKAMKHIYECGKYDPDMLGDEAIEALIRATYDTLMEGVNKGIQTKVTPEFRSALEENTFIFSGFKTHQELKEANDLLMGEYGGLKPYGQFAQDVRKIHENYNELYLRAEYRFAQQSATMASKWASWERRGVEMLQYRTAADDHVRPEHAALDGITRPRTDKFWDTMMPPNGWRCRCTVVPVDAADATETPADVAQRAAESVNQKPKQKIFNFNPGKVRKVFPPKHPYLPKGCGDCDKNLKLAYDPSSEKCQACAACARLLEKYGDKEEQKRIERNCEEYERLKNDENYKDVAFNPINGGVKASHIKHHFDEVGGEYEEHIMSAAFKNGDVIIFGSEESTTDGDRYTEGTWNKKLFEVAGRETATCNNVFKGLKHCAEKRITQYAVLDFPKGGFDENVVKRAISRYKGLEKLNDSQFVPFERVICVQNEIVVYDEPL